MTHAEISRFATRPPGMPQSECEGRVDLASAILDDTQPGEGDADDQIGVSIGDCVRCGRRLVVAEVAGGTLRLRNEYNPGA